MKLRLLLIIGLMSFLPQLAAKDFELSTAVNGVVQQVNVKVGETVKKGQVLLVLDQRVFDTRVKEAEKVLHSARLNKEEAKKELERAEELYERTVLSDHELNTAKGQFAHVDALLAKAESQLQQAAYDLEYSRVLAPINGKITQVNAWPGLVVNNSLKNTILLIINK